MNIKIKDWLCQNWLLLAWFYPNVVYKIENETFILHFPQFDISMPIVVDDNEPKEHQ
jgi:hypothetical protein